MPESDKTQILAEIKAIKDELDAIDKRVNMLRAKLAGLEAHGTQPGPGAFLTIPQIAEWSGRAESTVRSTLSRKGIKADKAASALSGERRFRFEDVQELFRPGRKLPERGKKKGVAA